MEAQRPWLRPTGASSSPKKKGLDVPLSSELCDSLKMQKGKTKVIISRLDGETKDAHATLASKKEATQNAETAMKPIQAELKEALRRIRVASQHLNDIPMRLRLYHIWCSKHLRPQASSLRHRRICRARMLTPKRAPCSGVRPDLLLGVCVIETGSCSI